MKLYGAVLAALALLGGCGGNNAPTPDPTSGAPIDAVIPDVPVMGREIAMLAIGDSLFTGYGLPEGDSYPAKLEAALRARGINARIANAGVSGDTTADGAQRLAFALDAQAAKPEVVLISLGGNDMLRGLPPTETRKNLDAMLAELKKRNIRVVLLGMLAAPNLGKDYAAAFNAIYPALAKQYGATLVPFFLQPLVEKPELVQADRVHPTQDGVAALVGATVETVATELPPP